MDGRNNPSFPVFLSVSTVSQPRKCRVETKKGRLREGEKQYEGKPTLQSIINIPSLGILIDMVSCFIISSPRKKMRHKVHVIRDFLGGPVAKNPLVPTQGAQVQSLARELHTACHNKYLTLCN